MTSTFFPAQAAQCADSGFARQSWQCPWPGFLSLHVAQLALLSCGSTQQNLLFYLKARAEARLLFAASPGHDLCQVLLLQPLLPVRADGRCCPRCCALLWTGHECSKCLSLVVGVPLLSPTNTWFWCLTPQGSWAGLAHSLMSSALAGVELPSGCPLGKDRGQGDDATSPWREGIWERGPGSWERQSPRFLSRSLSESPGVRLLL